MLRRTRLRIVGIDCPTCVYAIEKRLLSLGCVKSFRAEASTGASEVEFDDGVCTYRDIYRAIRDAGYDIAKEKLYFKGVSGEMAQVLESRILRKRGVVDARISQASGVVTVIYNPLETTEEDVRREMEAIDLEPLTGVVDESITDERVVLYRRLVSFAIGLAVIALSMYTMITGREIIVGKAMLILSLMALVAISSNYDIVMRGFRSLVAATPIMDSLIALSSVSTFVAGLASLAGLLYLYEGLHASSFFEASAGVIGFVGFGRYLEERLRRRAFRSLEGLIASLRGRARVVVEGGSVVEKPISEVSSGDVVEIRAGEVIPVDGVVVDGSGYVDESSFTGEPTPLIKRGELRDPVLAGSILVSGYLRVRATRVGDETMLAYIIETVREAESLKPRLARVADRVVGLFTWVVLAIALATLTFWWLIQGNVQLAVLIMAAVLTIACPCALGIAVPLVTSIAVLRSSRLSMLIRSGEVFEKLLSSDLFLFDKTGTLTAGKPAVLAIHPVGNGDIKEVLRLVCSVESRSEHPLSRAIVEMCRKEGLEFSDPEEYVHVPGEGVFGMVDDVSVAAGNMELASRLGLKVDEKVLKIVNEIGSRGKTSILLAVNSEVTAVLEVGDKLREEASYVVDELKKAGYRVGIVSGDVEASVRYYADIMKLDLAYWRMKPGDKADLIRKLQNNGHKVVFVGDGVNDAPALSTAYVGVAMGSGAEISKEAGDIVVMSNDLRSLLFLLRFSKVVRKKMIQNIGWALTYNAVLIPLAAGAFYTTANLFITPELAAVAMVLSDVSVVLNALSVLRAK